MKIRDLVNFDMLFPNVQKVALKHQKSKINQSCSIVSRRKTAKTNHRMKPYSKSLQKGNDHDRKTLLLHDMQVSPGFL
jgi:hypothetical protein